MNNNTTSVKRTSQPPSLLLSSAYVGLGTGAIGSSFFSGYATLRGYPVILFTIASGGQCFAIGSTFWFSRGLARAWMESEQRHGGLSFRDELACSTVAGSTAGIVGGAIRGRANIIPGAIMCGLIGLSGQAGFSTLAALDNTSRDRRPLLDRLSDSRWWPLKSIPDAEYKQQLSKQIDGLDVEISMINDQISALKQQRQMASTKN